MEHEQSSELRLESRSNIFVMAALYADGRSATPARIRNLSRTGALVEASCLPSVGSPVQLARASLGISATIMWVDGTRAGLQFTQPITIADWLPQGKRGIGQQFADELFHQKRLRSRKPPSSSELADTLLELKQSLERSGEELVQDSAVASRHQHALQTIDVIADALASLAASISGNDKTDSAT